jgi:CRP-like cAMP-binding protein
MFSLLHRTKPRFIQPRIADALLGTFSEYELGVLSRLGTIIELDEGAVIATEGRTGQEAVVVIDGTAAVSRNDEIVATVGVGTILGEGALLSGEPRNASLVATEPLTVIAMNRREFATLLDQCPRIDKMVHALAESRSAV